jgi:hypothetical protein
MEAVQNLSYCVTPYFAVTFISTVIMETHSAATRASSQLKPEKAKSPAAPKCGGKKDVVETVTITKGTTDKKEAADAVIEVSKVPNTAEIASKLKVRKRAPTTIKTTVNTDKIAVSSATAGSKNNFEDATTAIKTTVINSSLADPKNNLEDASTAVKTTKKDDAVKKDDATNTVETTAVKSVKKGDATNTVKITAIKSVKKDDATYTVKTTAVKSVKKNDVSITADFEQKLEDATNTVKTTAVKSVKKDDATNTVETTAVKKDDVSTSRPFQIFLSKRAPTDPARSNNYSISDKTTIDKDESYEWEKMIQNNPVKPYISMSSEGQQVR